MRLGMKIGMGLGLLATAASAGYRDSLDEDGCWDGRNQYGNMCVTGDSEWNGDRYTLILYNNCPQRVYVSHCNEKENSSYHDCGAWGLLGNDTKRWSTASGATGRSKWRTIGSTIGNKDWVCTSKIDGWHDKMFY